MATYTCSKCDGVGKIRAFSHVVGGTCFRCGGTGKIQGNAPKVAPAKPLTDWHIAQINAIENGDLNDMSYTQVLDLRDFAFQSTMPGINKPELLAIWRERCEPIFQEKQAEMRERTMVRW